MAFRSVLGGGRLSRLLVPNALLGVVLSCAGCGGDASPVPADTSIKGSKDDASKRMQNPVESANGEAAKAASKSK